jgi:hypothetical protein
MSNIFLSYHQVMQLRLLSLCLVFGALFPGLWLLIRAGFGAATRFARYGKREASQPRGQLS